MYMVMRPGEARRGQERIGEDRRGQERIGEDRRGQERIGEERPGEDRRGQERIVFYFVYLTDDDVDDAISRVILWLICMYVIKKCISSKHW